MKLYHTNPQNGEIKRVRRGEIRKLPFLPENIEIPLRRIAQYVAKGLNEFTMQVGIAVVAALMEAEVTNLVGPRGKHLPSDERAYYRHSYESGWVAMMGQKVHIERPRVRSKSPKGEVQLDTYAWAQEEGSISEAMLARILNGVSMRGYAETLDGESLEGYGTSKSRVSARFIRQMQIALQERLSQPLDGLDIVVLVVDGIRAGDHMILVAIGIDMDGHKHVLGLQEGATENEAAGKALLQDLVSRGLRCDQGLLVVIDGSKALRAAVRAVFGKAVVQRCQVHKKRNVLDHLPESAKDWVGRKIQNAYMEPNYAIARQSLEALADQLEVEYPGAASSLREGLEETLTLQRLGIPGLLRQSLASTNLIESAFSVAASKAHNVKRWRNGQQALQWVGAGLLEAERKFHRIRGYKLLGMLQAAIRKEVGVSGEIEVPAEPDVART